MNIWEFASGSPILSFCALLLICIVIDSLWQRACRALAIRKAGWPPEHCNADGKIKGEDE